MSNTVFHQSEKYLSDHYEVRYNTTSLCFQIAPKNSTDWQPLNENQLYVEMQKAGIKVSINNLMSLLKSDYTPHYSPIEDYFKSLPKWYKNEDQIDILASHVKALDQKQFNYHFKKWLVRTVKCAIQKDYFNKQAFILVHKKQNSGKTSFCRFLCPPSLSEYIAEDVPNDKDARILVAKNFIINLDELAFLSRREINSLKSLFSKVQINERLPYDSKNTIIPRIASFIGSTNQDTFLNDESGSVRWLCFAISSIDWSYTSRNIDNVWAQAYALACDTNFIAELTPEDIKENEKRNRQYQQLSAEQELISKYIISGDDFMTATDVMLYLKPRYERINRVQVGKALASLGFDRVKNSESQQYGYFLKTLDLFDTPDMVAYSSPKAELADKTYL